LEYFARMVSKARKRLASVEPDLPASSPPSRVTSHTEQNQRKQPKRRTLQSSPQDLLKLNEKEDPNSSNHIIPSEKTNQGKEPEEEQQQATEPHQLTLEREARERIFDEFKQEFSPSQSYLANIANADPPQITDTLTLLSKFLSTSIGSSIVSRNSSAHLKNVNKSYMKI